MPFSLHNAGRFFSLCGGRKETREVDAPFPPDRSLRVSATWASCWPAWSCCCRWGTLHGTLHPPVPAVPLRAHRSVRPVCPPTLSPPIMRKPQATVVPCCMALFRLSADTICNNHRATAILAYLGHRHATMEAGANGPQHSPSRRSMALGTTSAQALLHPTTIESATAHRPRPRPPHLRPRPPHLRRRHPPPPLRASRCCTINMVVRRSPRLSGQRMRLHLHVRSLQKPIQGARTRRRPSCGPTTTITTGVAVAARPAEAGTTTQTGMCIS